MILLFTKIGNWLLSKVLLALGLFVLALILLCIPRFLDDWVGTAEDRAERLEQSINGMESAIRELKQKQKEFESDIAGRAAELEESRAELEKLEGWVNKIWNLFNGGVRDRKIEKAKMAIEEEKKDAERLKTEKLKLEGRLSGTEKNIVDKEGELEDAREDLAERKNTRSDFQEIVGPKIRSALQWALVLWLSLVLGPPIVKTIVFYTLAPWVERAQPVIVGEATDRGVPTCTVSAPAQKIVLMPGEEMVAKEDYLQGNKEGLAKSTCWVWRWKFPVSSLLCGLVMLTRIRHLGREGEVAKTLTFSHQEDGMVEVAVITLGEGQELVFRPTFLAGLIYEQGSRPEIRSKWVFGKLHSWVTLQFRYFVVTGPARLVLVAGRGVQEEVITDSDDAFRINRNLTIAFTPALHYRSRRAETLMAYLRGKNPLFDDDFSGDGRLYNQQVASIEGAGKDAEKFWSKLLGGLGKVIGI